MPLEEDDRLPIECSPAVIDRRDEVFDLFADVLVFAQGRTTRDGDLCEDDASAPLRMVCQQVIDPAQPLGDALRVIKAFQSNSQFSSFELQELVPSFHR